MDFTFQGFVVPGLWVILASIVGATLPILIKKESQSGKQLVLMAFGGISCSLIFTPVIIFHMPQGYKTTDITAFVAFLTALFALRLVQAALDYVDKTADGWMVNLGKKFGGKAGIDVPEKEVKKRIRKKVTPKGVKKQAIPLGTKRKSRGK